MDGSDMYYVEENNLNDTKGYKKYECCVCVKEICIAQNSIYFLNFAFPKNFFLYA